jgi:hypothetical protein
MEPERAQTGKTLLLGVDPRSARKGSMTEAASASFRIVHTVCSAFEEIEHRNPYLFKLAQQEGCRSQ